MPESDLLIILKELLLKGNGVAYVLLSAMLLKRYVINGTVDRFFRLKEEELAIGRKTQELLTVIAAEQEALHTTVATKRDNN